MADFEDNNPFSGSERRLSSSSGADSDFASLDIHDHHDEPSSANLNTSNGNTSQTPGNFDNQPSDDIEDGETTPRRSYSSRVEQILYEHPTADVTISEAGKTKEGSSRGYIAYTIRLLDISVRRRYSEFESLRNNLVKLFPTLIVPPIPEKHSMSDYAASPTKAKEDNTIIELRRRMLTSFLNRCKSMQQIRACTVLQRFLDPNASWTEVLSTPPISLLPKQILQASPLDPSAESLAHSYLLIPPSSARLRVEKYPAFEAAKANTKEYESIILGIEKANRRIVKRYSDQASDLAELGAKFNAFSLEEDHALASSIEKVGQAIDNSYISMEALVSALTVSFSEPLSESAQFASVVRTVLKFQKQKAIQLELTADVLTHKKNHLGSLERTEQESQRINSYLQRDLSRHSADLTSQSYTPGMPTSTPVSPETSRSSTIESRESIDDPVSSPIDEPAESFPPTHADTIPVARTHKKKKSVFKIPGISKLNNVIHSIVDNDTEMTRRNNIGKTKEQIAELELALAAAKEDVELVSNSITKELARIQQTKEQDLKIMMVCI